MFLKKAMRYYRFWIYACNVSLLVGTIIFFIAFVWIFTDTRLTLFPTIRWYQPSLWYCYIALIMQAGVLQTIGCLGAVRMNEKYLNIYWCTIIALLFGDAFLGIIWMLRYNFVVANLRGDLKSRLNEEYGIDSQFQELWDRIQSDYHCCGIDGPYDYNMTKWMVSMANQVEAEKQSQQQQHHHRNHPKRHHYLVPKTCCRLKPDYLLPQEQLPITSRCAETYDPALIYIYGCHDAVHHWFQKSASILSVLGFCVISFIKLCFLCILRYEIKEMIQKIKVQKGMAEVPCVPGFDLEAYLPRPSMQQDSAQTLLSNPLPQSNYRSNEQCRHINVHHQHSNSLTGNSTSLMPMLPPSLPLTSTTTTTNPSTTQVKTSTTNDNNNELNASLSKKHSIV